MPRRALAAALSLLTLASLVVVAAADSAPVPPAKDSFYRWSAPLDRVAPGTPLRVRDVTLGATTSSTPLPATQVLYRTTDATGQPALSVTTVVLPVSGTTAPRVVGYLSFYDALTSRCDPSFTLRGGDAGAANVQNSYAEQLVVHWLHQSGFVVTVPDVENEGADFVAGNEYGMSALDGVRATLRVLRLGPATPVGLLGYSGGSIAADWASELAPSYAPRLNLVGTAMGGIPADLAHMLRYVDGSASWSSITPGVLAGLARAYRLDLSPYLSPLGRRAVARVQDQCIGEFSGTYRLASLFQPRYGDPLRIPVLRRVLDRLRMGSAPGHPRLPLLMVAGNQDGTGDGVTVAADQRALAAQYCAQGVPVQFEEVPHGEHTQTGIAFMPQAAEFLSARFAGAPPVSTC